MRLYNLAQASWNVCPTPAPGTIGYQRSILHGDDCYYDSNQPFAALEGTVSRVVPDIPDGKWEVRVYGDVFNKVCAGGGGASSNPGFERKHPGRCELD